MSHTKHNPDAGPGIAHDFDCTHDPCVCGRRVTDEFDTFWRPIVMPDGEWDHDQVMRELYDYKIAIDNVSKVYDHVTGGRVSKPNVIAADVIGEADAYTEKLIAEAIEESVPSQADRVQRLAWLLVEQGYSTTRSECDAASLIAGLFDDEIVGWPETPAFSSGSGESSYALPGELHSDPPHEYEPEHCAACAAIAKATGDLAQ